MDPLSNLLVASGAVRWSPLCFFIGTIMDAGSQILNKKINTFNIGFAYLNGHVYIETKIIIYVYVYVMFKQCIYIYSVCMCMLFLALL